MAGVVTKRRGTKAIAQSTLLLTYVGGNGIDIPFAGTCISYDTGETWELDLTLDDGGEHTEGDWDFVPNCTVKDSNGDVLVAGTHSGREMGIVYNYTQNKYYRFNYTYYDYEEPFYYNGYGGVADIYSDNETTIVAVERADWSLVKAPIFEYDSDTDSWVQSDISFSPTPTYVSGITKSNNNTLITCADYPSYVDDGIFVLESTPQKKQDGGFYCICNAGNGVLYAGEASGVNSGHVYKSTDSGLTWSDLGIKGNLANPAIERIKILGNNRIGFLSNEEFYYTDNDFTSCTLSLNVASYGIFKLNENVCFTFNNFIGSDVGINKSNDNGETWESIVIVEGFQGVITSLIPL